MGVCKALLSATQGANYGSELCDLWLVGVTRRALGPHSAPRLISSRRIRNMCASRPTRHFFKVHTSGNYALTCKHLLNRPGMLQRGCCKHSTNDTWTALSCFLFALLFDSSSASILSRSFELAMYSTDEAHAYNGVYLKYADHADAGIIDLLSASIIR